MGPCAVGVIFQRDGVIEMVCFDGVGVKEKAENEQYSDEGMKSNKLELQ